MTQEPPTNRFIHDAGIYAAARPTYPDELYRYLASLVPQATVVWDCATGNGQAARDLARWFPRLIATDASESQIANATPQPGVEFCVARAESSGIEPGSVDLTTVAQALHWFDLDAFYGEVRRVSRPGALIAVWSYGACHAGRDIEAELREFEDGTVGPYWDPRRRWVDEGYQTIPFPFPEVTTPDFELRVEWSLRQLGEYLRSWSAVARFRRERGSDPVAPFLERLVKTWGHLDHTRAVTWPLSLRVGRVG